MAGNDHEVKCGKCFFKSSDPDVLETHDRQIHYKPVLCEFCANLFSPRKLAEHIETCHKELINNVEQVDLASLRTGHYCEL